VKLPSLDPAAKIELLEATRYYLEINPELASDFVDRVEFALDRICNHPLRFARLETVNSDRDIRRVLVGRFPYLIVYEVLNGEPYVLAIAHAHRRPNYWLVRKGEQA
jgi:plasmid stabilization system protein ParE